MKKSAFTLIELLVVIAIIAILAALAIPTIGSAIDRAHTTTDANNLRQLGIGVVQYLNDNDDDMFPFAAGSGGSWPSLLRAKVADWKIFQSAFDKRRPSTSSPYNVSYAINSNVMGMNTSKFNSPSELIIMAPDNNSSSGVAFTGTSTGNMSISPGGANGVQRKNKEINALFADSHVVAMRATDFKDGSSEKGRRRWNPQEPVN